MRPSIARNIAIAALWGAVATWIFWWSFDRVSGAVLVASAPAVSRAVISGWATADQINPLLGGLINLLSALLYGFVFGFPLGLAIANSRSMLVSWLVFTGAFFVTLVARMLFEPIGIGALLHNITHSIYWLTALSTLLFVFLGDCVRSAYARRRAV